MIPLSCRKIMISSNFTTRWNWLKMDLERVFSSSPSFHQTYVASFKYFPVVTVWWNFLRRFKSSIPRDIYGFISEIQIFFKELPLFRVWFLETFDYRTICYLQVPTTRWNFLYHFLPLPLISHTQCFWIYFQIFNIFFRKTYSWKKKLSRSVQHRENTGRGPNLRWRWTASK